MVEIELESKGDKLDEEERKGDYLGIADYTIYCEEELF